MANDHETTSWSQLQRIYEIIYFRDLYARTHGRDQASAMNIAAAYAKVRMANGGEVISRFFIETALTIHGRVLGIPAAERLLLDMGNLPRTENPFNSVQRLQAIVSKCENNKDHITWARTRQPHGLRTGC